MKHTYIVSYDIKGGADYEPLYDALKSYSAWAKITESSWALITEDSHTEIRDNLKQHLT
ncbi:hypothetical protein SAMN05421509_102381 [Chromohalobacter canadensis]|uniref:CRISPR-associated protein Cas2 n=1 Tax=Chromohalobacter canadensis TaxID=141389 RepID=A0A285VIS5_9GAMM|nr:hypothetical protein SAMN05421509_102381 [Chromohalobacter canadensis]